MSDERVLVALAEREAAALRVLCRRCLRSLRAAGEARAPSDVFAANVADALDALSRSEEVFATRGED